MSLYTLIVEYDIGDGSTLNATTPNITLQDLPDIIKMTDDLGQSLISVQRQCGRVETPELIPTT